jgi:hypothetical protein
MQMKKTFIRLVIALLVLPLALFAVNMARIMLRMNYLKNADHAAILTACREAIDHRTDYRNDKDQWGTLHNDDVLLIAPLTPDIPEALRDLHPHDILIRGDHIIVNMGLPFCRLGLIAFPKGQDEYGTFKYIDGLWFWNGNFQSEEMRTRVYNRAAKRKDGQPSGRAYVSPAAGDPSAHP